MSISVIPNVLSQAAGLASPAGERDQTTVQEGQPGTPGANEFLTILARAAGAKPNAPARIQPAASSTTEAKPATNGDHQDTDPTRVANAVLSLGTDPIAVLAAAGMPVAAQPMTIPGEQHVIPGGVEASSPQEHGHLLNAAESIETGTPSPAMPLLRSRLASGAPAAAAVSASVGSAQAVDGLISTPSASQGIRMVNAGRVLLSQGFSIPGGNLVSGLQSHSDPEQSAGANALPSAGSAAAQGPAAITVPTTSAQVSTGPDAHPDQAQRSATGVAPAGAAVSAPAGGERFTVTAFPDGTTSATAAASSSQTAIVRPALTPQERGKLDAAPGPDSRADSTEAQLKQASQATNGSTRPADAPALVRSMAGSAVAGTPENTAVIVGHTSTGEAAPRQQSSGQTVPTTAQPVGIFGQLTPSQDAAGVAGRLPGPNGQQEVATSIVSQIAHRATLHLGNGQSSMELQLEPEELGRVSIQVLLQNGHVEVHVVAESAHARAAIQQSLPELRSALEHQGLQADRFSVDTPGLRTGSGWSQGDAYRQSAPRSELPWQSTRWGAPEEDRQAAPQRIFGASSRLTLIDYRV